MAPRLPADVALQLNSFGWPVWLLCTSITIGAFSVLAVFAYTRIQTLEEEKRRHLHQLQYDSYQQQKQHPHQKLRELEVSWSFPDKEDKAARFRRWADVLRFKPREARPPITSDCPRLDVKVALEVFYREAEAAGLASPPPASKSEVKARPNPPSSPKHEAVSIPEEDALAAMLREKVKERILQFLIECGPPKGLMAITEEDRSGVATPSVPSTPSAAACSHPIDVWKLPAQLPASGASTPSAPSTPRSMRPQASPRPPAALALDGEAVLRTETGETVTRELLWAVLARIHAETSAAISASSAPPTTVAASPRLPAAASPPPPASAASVDSQGSPGSGSSNNSTDHQLTQPLLGEWKNPLLQ